MHSNREIEITENILLQFDIVQFDVAAEDANAELAGVQILDVFAEDGIQGRDDDRFKHHPRGCSGLKRWFDVSHFSYCQPHRYKPFVILAPHMLRLRKALIQVSYIV